GMGRAHLRAAREQQADPADHGLRRTCGARVRADRRARRIARAAERRMPSPRSFADVYAAAARDPETFWAEAAIDVDWLKRWRRVLDRSRRPFYRWFEGGELNTCFNAVDRHVASGRGAQNALIYDSPVTQTVARYTFADLQREVAQLAGALLRLGVGRGD